MKKLKLRTCNFAEVPQQEEVGACIQRKHVEIMEKQISVKHREGQVGNGTLPYVVNSYGSLVAIKFSLDSFQAMIQRRRLCITDGVTPFEHTVLYKLRILSSDLPVPRIKLGPLLTFRQKRVQNLPQGPKILGIDKGIFSTYFSFILTTIMFFFFLFLLSLSKLPYSISVSFPPHLHSVSCSVGDIL